MIQIIKGDLFQSINPEVNTYIAHVVNNRGLWAAGFALQINKHFGDGAMNDYKSVTPYDANLLGSCLFYEVQPNLKIVSLYAMDGVYNYKTNPKPLQYDYLHHSLLVFYKTIVRVKKCEVLMPQIGAGLARGDWSVIRSIIESLVTVPTKIFILETNI